MREYEISMPGSLTKHAFIALSSARTELPTCILGNRRSPVQSIRQDSIFEVTAENGRSFEEDTDRSED